MAIKIAGNPVIDDDENLTIDGYAHIEGNVTIGSDFTAWTILPGTDGDLRIKKGNTVLFQMQGDPATGRLWLEDRLSAKGVVSFGDRYANEERRVELYAGTGQWAKYQLHVESNEYWDIKSKSNDTDGALQFRHSSDSNGRMLLKKDGTLNIGGDIWATSGTAHLPQIDTLHLLTQRHGGTVACEDFCTDMGLSCEEGRLYDVGGWSTNSNPVNCNEFAPVCLCDGIIKKWNDI